MPSVKKVAPFLHQKESRRESLFENAFILSFGRLFITSLILGTSLLIPEHGKNILQIPSNTQLYILTASIYLYSVIFLFLFNSFKDSQFFIFLQILIDLAFITAFVTISGGVESIFIFLYFFAIIAGALFLSRMQLFLVVLVATLFYGGSTLKTAPFHALLHHQFFNFIWENRFTIYRLTLQLLALWGVAILTNVLSSELQKRKQELLEKTKEYQKLERFNENVLQSIESGILTVDPLYLITYLNKAGEKILEIPKTFLLNRDIRTVLPPLAKRLTNNGNSRNTIRHNQLVLKKPNGYKKVIGFSISTLFDSENNASGKIVIFQDLTRYKAMEDRVHESEKLATVGRFAAGLAHEIRNPLASLSGSIQVLKDSLELSGSDKELMNIVLRETDRLNRLVSDFLLFSQFSKGKLKHFNLSPLIDEILSILKKENRDDGLRIENRLPPSLPIYSDRDKLKQVFWNVLINAIQAKDKKTHIITIERVPSPPVDVFAAKDVSITIAIRDNGKGISKAAMKKIFEPFFTTRPDGTGLGLSIAYQIMNSLGGSIIITSKEKKGTNVFISIPV